MTPEQYRDARMAAAKRAGYTAERAAWRARIGKPCTDEQMTAMEAEIDAAEVRDDARIAAEG